MGFGLILIHGVVYQLVENRELPYGVFTIVTLLVILVQGAGWWQRRREDRFPRD